MSMEDSHWKELTGGYRIPFDPRALISRLLASPWNAELWDELTQELYHQGDVGEASYAAVPRLLALSSIENPPWQLFALVASIELARSENLQNPPVPAWLSADYSRSLETFAVTGMDLMKHDNDPDRFRAVASLFLLWKAKRTYASALLNYSEDELKELLP